MWAVSSSKEHKGNNMPRKIRIVVPGHPHHVTQRGNQRSDVFHSPADYQQYLLWLRHYAQRENVRVWAYCLMPNHVHLIAVPEQADGLTRLFRTFHGHYAQFLNDRLNTTGHVWEQRYYSMVLDEDHLLAAVRYVERNPVRAGLVAEPSQYHWSSAQGHCGLREDPGLADDLPLLGMISDWPDWLRTEDEAATADLRIRTARGMPGGSREFLECVQRLTGLDPWQR